MRICIQKSTGRLLEMQSAATEGTLLANAASSHPQIASDDLEEKVVDEAEWARICAGLPQPEAEEQDLVVTHSQLRAALQAAGVSGQQVEAAMAATKAT